MYPRIYSIDVLRSIKSYTTAAFVFNCLVGLFVFLLLSLVVLALLPFYLPVHHFIPTNLHHTLNLYVYCQISSMTPNRSSRSTVVIDQNNWPTVELTMQSLLNSKLNRVQLTNLSDVRIVDSIESEHVPTTWCQASGCLRVLTEVLFSVDCSSACQLRQMKQIETSNSIEPSIKISLNSTLNMAYVLELDAFTVVVLDDTENGDEMNLFLIYSLTGTQFRAVSLLNIPVDNSSLSNITRLVNNSIIQSEMNISTFLVVHADVNTESSILNVTVLFRFIRRCMTNCQETQVKKLKNTTSINWQPIVIIYNGSVHSYNASFTDVFDTTSMIIPSLTTQNILNSTESTTERTSSSIIYFAESIFEVFYKLVPYDLIIAGDLQLGPIIDSSNIDDLTDLMQTTVWNYTDISTTVFNATIESDNASSIIQSPSIDSINYILHLVVYYIYPITCNGCIDISNNAVYTTPQVSKLIQIRNATLIDISSPILVIHLTPYLRTTGAALTDTASMSTIEYSITNSNDQLSTHINHTTTPHPTTEHTSTITHTTHHTSTHH